MKYVTRGFATCIGMTMILTIFAIPAFAETPITSCPFNITAPGNYVLNADLTCGTTGITITASNVSLKLNGHKIAVLGVAAAGGGPIDGIAITVDGYYGRVNHIGIQGPGLITSRSQDAPMTGILLRSADYSQVSQVMIVGASTVDNGIAAVDCNFLTLTSNVIGHSGGGVAMYESNSSSLIGNDTSGNIFAGIYLLEGSSNTVNNNIANGNSNYGIHIEGSGAKVYGNVTNGNGQYGIFNLSTTGQTFSNTAKANGQFDLFDPIACSGSWSDNVFLTANAPCIH